MNLDTKYGNCELSRLYNEVATPTFISTIREVLNMISKEESDPYNRIHSKNITLEEEIMFENIFGIKDYSKYLTSSMQKNNMRFFFLPDINIDYCHIDYCIKSKINESKNNEFTSYFIGKLTKNNENITIDFVMNVIIGKIIKILNNSYNINFEELLMYCSSANESNSDYINACISLFHVLICSFEIADDILDLKYKDCDIISKSILTEDIAMNLSFFQHHYVKLDAIKSVIELCFNFAITDNRDPGDYEIMVKQCFNTLIGVGVYKRVLNVKEDI